MLPYIVLAVVFSPYLLWFFYLAIMSIYRGKETASTFARYLGYPIFLIGYVLDVLINVTLFSLLVLDFPREWTITTHINRLAETDKGWRRVVGCWICRNLLDAFDPDGFHCRSCGEQS